MCCHFGSIGQLNRLLWFIRIWLVAIYASIIRFFHQMHTLLRSMVGLFGLQSISDGIFHYHWKLRLLDVHSASYWHDNYLAVRYSSVHMAAIVSCVSSHSLFVWCRLERDKEKNVFIRTIGFEWGICFRQMWRYQLFIPQYSKNAIVKIQNKLYVAECTIATERPMYFPCKK